MGPLGWLLSLTPKARKKKREEKELERLKIALLIYIDNDDNPSLDIRVLYRGIQCWLSGIIYIDFDQTIKVVQALDTAKFIKEDHVNYKFTLTLKGKIYLADSGDYPLLLRLYKIFYRRS